MCDIEKRTVGTFAQDGDQLGIPGPDAEIAAALVRTAGTAADIEQDCIAILLPQRTAIRPDLGQLRAAAPRGAPGRQAERDALRPPPAIATERFVRNGGCLTDILKPDAAAIGDAGQRIRIDGRSRLVRIAVAFRDGAIAAPSPTGARAAL